MRTYTGIVCEKKSKYSVFLTNEGKFLRGIPVISNPEIGEEVEFRLVTATLQQKRIKPFFIGPALVAAVLLVFLVASFIPNTSSALAAYVQLEGETALELGVNHEGNVVSLRSLVNDPITIDEWEQLPLAIVLDKAVSQMNPKVEKLEIIMIYENEEQAETKKIVEEAVRTVQNEHTNRVWKVSESTEEERAKANKTNQTIKQLRKTEQAPAIKNEQKQAPVQPSTPETKKEKQQAPPKEIPQPKVEKQQIKQGKQEEKSQKKNEKEEQKAEKKNDGNQGNEHNNNQGNENSNKENKPHNNQGNNNTNNQENKNSNNQGNKNKEGNNNNKQ
ncbi:anti-sigma factor domain-containing protein [Psychrobacillus lasiicapitis]|nr:anti-sigma factor domain-containing protein [Psychrobacillus lasiicapitis]